MIIGLRCIKAILPSADKKTQLKHKKTMTKIIYTKKISILLIIFIAIALTQEISAKRSSFSHTKKSTPKPAYEGLGKPSKANGRIKIKTTRGYFKPSNGYKFVNPYARSK